MAHGWRRAQSGSGYRGSPLAAVTGFRHRLGLCQGNRPWPSGVVSGFCRSRLHDFERVDDCRTTCPLAARTERRTHKRPRRLDTSRRGQRHGFPVALPASVARVGTRDRQFACTPRHRGLRDRRRLEIAGTRCRAASDDDRPACAIQIRADGSAPSREDVRRGRSPIDIEAGRGRSILDCRAHGRYRPQRKYGQAATCRIDVAQPDRVPLRRVSTAVRLAPRDLGVGICRSHGPVDDSCPGGASAGNAGVHADIRWTRQHTARDRRTLPSRNSHYRSTTRTRGTGAWWC